mmetsp:Transcript_7247/g.25903  ORF Transcript_7247/g.25903 Transcript_7247/m.25903 type:complete len:278 (+) Transcript_7247:2067-2900(+)
MPKSTSNARVRTSRRLSSTSAASPVNSGHHSRVCCSSSVNLRNRMRRPSPSTPSAALSSAMSAARMPVMIATETWSSSISTHSLSSSSTLALMARRLIGVADGTSSSSSTSSSSRTGTRPRARRLPASARWSMARSATRVCTLDAKATRQLTPSVKFLLTTEKYSVSSMCTVSNASDTRVPSRSPAATACTAKSVFQPDRMLRTRTRIMLATTRSTSSRISTDADLAMMVSKGARNMVWKWKRFNSAFSRNFCDSCLSESIANIAMPWLLWHPTVVK